MNRPFRLLTAFVLSLAVTPLGFPIGWALAVENPGYGWNIGGEELLFLFLALWLPSAILGVGGALVARRLGGLSDRTAMIAAVPAAFVASVAAHAGVLYLASNIG